MNDDIEYPTAIKKTFYNSSKRRKNGKGAKGYVLYYYDRNIDFHTRRLSWLEAHFNRPTFYRLRKGKCIDCGRPSKSIFSRRILSFLSRKAQIKCAKCLMMSP